MLFRNVSFAIVSDPSAPIAEAVRNSNYDAILAVFPVAAYGPDSAAGDRRDATVHVAAQRSERRSRRSAGQLDATRSFLERVAAYPTNVEVEAALTINAQPQAQSFFPGLPPAAAGAGHAHQSTKSVVDALVDGEAPREPDDAASP